MTSTLSIAGPERLPLTDDPAILSILRVHYALWNREDFIERGGKTYKPFVPEHQGYTSVVLPNDQGYNFLWITHNINKSSSGTYSIKKAASQGNDLKLTWIVDNNDSKFKYIGVINTCMYFDGSQDILIEKYDGDSTQVVWTNMPFYQQSKSKY